MHSMWMRRFHLFVQFPHTHTRTHYSLTHLIFMLSEFMMQQIAEFYCFFTYCTACSMLFLLFEGRWWHAPNTNTRTKKIENKYGAAMLFHVKLCAAVWLSSWFLINFRPVYSVCATCFFRLRNVQTAINRIFRIGWIQITLRFVMPFIRVCEFFTACHFHSNSYHIACIHPCTHMCLSQFRFPRNAVLPFKNCQTFYPNK